MDLAWFLELEPPVQTAIITLPTALLGAVGGIIILFVKKPSPQRQSSQMVVAGGIVDNGAMDRLSHSIDHMCEHLTESNKWRERETRAIELLTKELAEGRAELRLQNRLRLNSG